MSWTLPKTWNVGDVLTSTDMNTYVRDNSNYLYGDTAPVGVTHAANWGNLGGWPALTVKRFGSSVLLEGVIVNNTGATQGSGANMGTVPAGYAPASTGSVYMDISGTHGRVDVGTSGAINIGNGNVGNGVTPVISGVYSLV